jgi:hypothetical protein
MAVGLGHAGGYRYRLAGWAWCWASRGNGKSRKGRGGLAEVWARESFLKILKLNLFPGLIQIQT